MECKSCGAPIKDGEKSCSYCGKVSDDAVKAVTPMQKIIKQVHKVTNPSKDSPHLGFALISFFIPLIGIILYCLWRNGAPLKAKSCIKGAIFGIVAYALLGIIISVAVYFIVSNYAQEFEFVLRHIFKIIIIR